MAETKHIVKFWRGSRASYNILSDSGKLDYWTRYSVKEDSGEWKEYYGSNLISTETGQLLPVIDIVDSLPKDLKPGDRYILRVSVPGSGISYNIVDIRLESLPEGGSRPISIVNKMTEGISVRVKSKGYMSYQLFGDRLVTYDQVDCGSY